MVHFEPTLGDLALASRLPRLYFFQNGGKINNGGHRASRTLTANEAACVTGVPLRQVHRIIDTGVLGSAAARREGSRLVHGDGLVSLKLDP